MPQCLQWLFIAHHPVGHSGVFSVQPHPLSLRHPSYIHILTVDLLFPPFPPTLGAPTSLLILFPSFPYPIHLSKACLPLQASSPAFLLWLFSSWDDFPSRLQLLDIVSLKFWSCLPPLAPPVILLLLFYSKILSF